MRKLLSAVIAASALGVVAACVPPTPGPGSTTTTVSSTTTSSIPPGHSVDQQYTGVPGSVGFTVHTCYGDSYEVAQTFTAGRTGVLDQVSLVARKTGVIGDLIVRIQNVVSRSSAGGVEWVPGRDQLGFGRYSGTGSPDNSTFIDVPLTDSASVVAGTRYAIVLTGASGCNVASQGNWSPQGDRFGPNGEEDPYPAGVQWDRTVPYTDWRGGSRDLLFKTWVR